MSLHAHATLALPYAAVRDFMQQTPVFADRGTQDADGTLWVQFGTGTMHLVPQGETTTLHLQSPDAASLQALRDFIAEEAAESGVTPQWHDPVAIGRPKNLCIATLIAVQDISPAYRRLWLQGPDLARLMTGGLHFRLLIGPQNAPWPDLDDAGLTRWHGGARAWHRPVYTVRSLTGTGADTRISVDIFLHDGGRVTTWTKSLTSGQEIGLMGPSGGDIPPAPGPVAPWYGLFGDETALPAIARILAALPHDARGRAVLTIPTLADAQPLDHPPAMTLDWLPRDTNPPTALNTALQNTPLPPDNRFVFYAASSSETTEARRILATRGLKKAELWAQSYWVDTMY